MNDESRPRTSFISTAKMLLMFVLLILLALFVYKHQEEFQFILSMKTGYLFPAFLLISVGQVLTAYHFNLVITCVSHPISFFTAFKYFTLGAFINVFVPHGGGVYRTVMFKKDGNIRYRDGISILVSFGWLSTLVSLGMGVIIVAIYKPAMQLKEVPVLLFFILLLLVQVLSIRALDLWVQKFHSPRREGLRRILQMGGDIVERITAVMKNTPLLLKSIILISVNVGLTIWALNLLFASIGAPADITYLTIYAVTIRLSSVIELTPGNLGVREFVFALLSSGMGQGAAQGITISMMWRLITVISKGVLSLAAVAIDKSHTSEKTDAKKNGGIFLLGPSAPFRGGIALYNTLLFNHLQERRGVLFYTFKKQYFKWMFPGKDDHDNSSDKIELKYNDGPGQNNGTLVKRVLHPLNLVSWIRAGKEARQYPLILLPWWVIFWAPYYLLFIFIAGRKGNKIIFLCHNVEEHERGLASGVKRFIARRVLKKGDGFIVHSRGEERQLTRLIKKKAALAVVSPLPLVEVFAKNRYTPATSREKLGIPAGRKVILFFGFVREYKGLTYLLKALPLVKTYDPNILLLIVGEVWGKQTHYDRYMQMIKELGIEENILFINRYVYNEEVEMYFKAGDFVVLPYTDGSGSGILQVAYGLDRPVVTTDIGAFADVVLEGKTGFMVPPADEKSLAEAIIKMYRDGCIPRMEEEVRQYKKQFEWSYMVERLLSFEEAGKE
ncbi:MAG: hypothetical protein QG657_4294 [Acidobacteriota bacterium]|nr:hypothetical protein [Acidobacteriota bacterium]